MGKKEEYIDRLSEQLKVWSARIDEFTERASHEALEHKTRLMREISDLNAKRLDAQIKLRQVKDTSGDAWETLTEGMDKAWGDMKEAVHKIGEKFKQPR